MVGIAAKRLHNGMAELLPAERYHQGIEVQFSNDQIIIDLYVVLEYGLRISEIAHNVMGDVEFAVEKMLGVPGARVNVNVQGLGQNARYPMTVVYNLIPAIRPGSWKAPGCGIGNAADRAHHQRASRGASGGFAAEAGRFSSSLERVAMANTRPSVTRHRRISVFDGQDLKRAMLAGASWLEQHRDSINALNVFPGA